MREGSRRVDRVADLVREVLSDLLVKGVKDPRVSAALVTVTDVDVSPDLRHARVYVSTLGDEAAQEAGLAGLRSAAGYLRRELGRHLHTKYTPELHFDRDPSLAAAARVEELLTELREADEAPPPQEDEP